MYSRLTWILLAFGCSHKSIPLDSAPAEDTSDSAVDTSLDSIPIVPTADCVLVTVTGEPSAVGTQLYATEGQAVSWQLECSDHPSASLTLAEPPGDATWAENALSWAPGLDDAGRYDLGLIADVDGTAASVTATLWIADAWDDPSNIEVDPLTYAEEFGVPVLNLELPPGTNYETDTTASLYWQGHEYTVGVQYRGASSSYYPKHSYSVGFSSDDEFDAPGWHHRRNLNITSTFDDNSYIRQKMCYDLWTALSDTHPEFQTMMVVLYLNNHYEGLQLITDHIDGEWWQDNGLSDLGNLYKAVDHSANLDLTYGGRRKSSLSSGYEKKSGDQADWSDLEDLVEFVATSDDTTFEAELDSRMSRDDFMNWWVFVRFVDGGDSAGKNSYLYHDPSVPGSLWQYTPWDFNHSMGQDWETIRVAGNDPEDFTGSNRFFERAFENPTLASEMTARMRSALDGPFGKDTILARYDDEYAIIDASARRDWEKWQTSYDSYWGWRGDLNDYDAEVAYLREWAGERWDYMDRVTRP